MHFAISVCILFAESNPEFVQPHVLLDVLAAPDSRWMTYVTRLIDQVFIVTFKSPTFDSLPASSSAYVFFAINNTVSSRKKLGIFYVHLDHVLVDVFHC